MLGVTAKDLGSGSNMGQAVSRVGDDHSTQLVSSHRHMTCYCLLQAPGQVTESQAAADSHACGCRNVGAGMRVKSAGLQNHIPFQYLGSCYRSGMPVASL